MRAQSAALGIAAAAALSSPASALPCAATTLSKTTIAEFSCTVTGDMSSSLARHQQGGVAAEASSDGSQPPAGQSALLLDATETVDAETFVGSGIKITNLQATMTSNKYVAGRLPIAAAPPIEDLMMFSPDYLSVKTLPRIPQRNPVGVGLVTLPKPTVKDADTAPNGVRLRQRP
jgi:hypothetical protein